MQKIRLITSNKEVFVGYAEYKHITLNNCKKINN